MGQEKCGRKNGQMSSGVGEKYLDQSSEKKQEKSIIRIKQYLTINIVEKPEPRFGRGECLNHSAEKKDEPEKQEVEMDMVLVEAYSLMNEPVVQQEGFGWKK